MHSSEPRILRIELPPGIPLLNANDRDHWAVRAKKTRDIKTEVVKQVEGEAPFTGKVRARGIYHPPTRGSKRYDPDNFVPTLKAVLDALHPVTAKNKQGEDVPQPFVYLLPDDNSRYVTEVSLMIMEQRVPEGQFIVQVIEDL
jgi:hypothetical protein